MSGIKHSIDKTLEWAVILLMAANVLNVLWQVFTRFILNDPSSYTEELARYLLIWIGLLGASYAVGKKLHLAIDHFSGKLQGFPRQMVDFLVPALIFLFALLVMVIGGIRLVNITLTLNQISAALQIKLGYIYLVLPLSGLLMMYYSLHFVWEQIISGKKSYFK